MKLNNFTQGPTVATVVLLLNLILVVSLLPSYGQTVTASLSGIVTDQTGATIPDASIVATNVDTSTSTKTTSGPGGNYIFPALYPGTYSLSVEKTGFKSSQLTGIKLLVDQKATMDIQLEVGEITTKVEVSAAAPLVENTTASVGTVIGSVEAVELPLNIRRFGALATLVPGTTTDNGGFASQSFGSPFSETSYAANGARSASNNIIIDGSDSRNLTFGGFAVQPTPDAVQEFKIQTNIYSAAFGRAAGSTINLVTKSGTNEIHGTGYEFLRNSALDARNFFATDKPEFIRNQFGVALGGPIRKNKTFIFGNYEGLRQKKGLSLTALTPTAQQLNGDFSNVLTGNTINLCGSGGPANLNFDSGQLFDPASEHTFACPGGSGKAGQNILVGNPIPGNRITNIDPVAQHVISQAAFPAPNRSGFPNFVNQQPLVRNDNQFIVKVDHAFSSKDQFFGRYLFGQSDIKDTTLAYTVLPNFGDTVYYRGQNVALNWTHTFGPTLLNELRGSFQRNYDIAACEKCPREPGFMQGFGINNFKALSAGDEGFPIFTFSNFATVGDSNYRPVISPDMVEKYQDNLTWTKGRHTMVFGADMQFWQVLREEAPFSPHGEIYFDGRFSSLASQITNVSGISDLADFLLGYPRYAARTLRFLNTNQVGGGFWSWYAQDDFKVNSRLSINLGLRYEYRRPAVDKGNNYATFVATGPKFSGPGNGVLVTAADDSLNDSFCTDPSYSYLSSADGRCLVATSAQRAALGFTDRTRRTLIFTDKRNFAPRFGLTWRPTSSDKLIVRGGYGIFYDLANFNNQHFVDNNPVFSPSQLYQTAVGSPPPLTNGVPTTTANIFAGGGGVPHLSDQFVSLYVSPNYKAPYFQQWSFGISSQLSTNWALDVNYIGTRGLRLGNLHIYGNQPYPGVEALQPRRPYVDFGPMLFTTPDSSSKYNSLQVKVNKRFAGGLSFLGAYTFAHSINDNEGDEGFGGGVGNTAPQNDNDLQQDRGRTANDARQRLVLSYIYELPFGSGKRFLNKGGATNVILGGWQVSGITSYQSGFPFSVLSSQDFSNTGTLVARPDRSCTGEGKKTVDSWFDASCFPIDSLQAALASGTPRFGNSGRNILTGPALHNWDLAFMKRFKFSERFDLQFRAEFFNTFNFAQFFPPETHVGNPNIGKISRAREPRDIQFGLKLTF
jgi:hypothetical protein